MTTTEILQVIDSGATIFLLSFTISFAWGLGQELIKKIFKK